MSEYPVPKDTSVLTVASKNTKHPSIYSFSIYIKGLVPKGYFKSPVVNLVYLKKSNKIQQQKIPIKVKSLYNKQANNQYQVKPI